MTGRTEERTIQCHLCPNAVTLKVTLGVWSDKFTYCIDQSAKHMGFRPTPEGPVCPFHEVAEDRPHAFVMRAPGTRGKYPGPAEETCEVCGRDPRNSCHEVKP
jgi:hypothetical protein